MKAKTLTNETLTFLKNLERNNNRDWFSENKAFYESAKEEFENFVAQLIIKISAFDDSVASQEAKKCIFRIYRDVRFSKDKSPYKVHFGAHITPGESKSNESGAGYYFHLQLGASMLAGGAYQPQPAWLKNIRDEIDYDADRLKSITDHESFKRYFGEIEGEKLKKAPKGYPADHPEVELLKFKSFTAVHRVPDEKLLSEDFLNHAAGVFKALYPLNSFLNKALYF